MKVNIDEIKLRITPIGHIKNGSQECQVQFAVGDAEEMIIKNLTVLVTIPTTVSVLLQAAVRAVASSNMMILADLRDQRQQKKELE